MNTIKRQTIKKYMCNGGINVSGMIALGILFVSMISYSQNQKEIEYRFKAVYLLNFLQFIEWPDSVIESDQSPIILSVVGDDPFGDVIDETFQNEKIGTHPVLITRFRSINEIGKCHAVFISASEKNALQERLRRLNESSILTVSDIENFGEQGGGIGFYLEKNKVRFKINLLALKQGDLKASSKLLRLATIIYPL